MPELSTFFAGITRLVNAELDRLVPVEGVAPQSLRDAVRWSLFGGGKHFRPALVFAVGRTFDAPDHQLVGTASAVEMLHTYSLIHDDLPSMDDDDLRRGRETCHKKFGEATAILAGDALQALAFQVIAEDTRLPVETRIDLISKLAQAAAKMVVGQQLDLEAEGKPTSLEDTENIHRNKTGALIRFSAEAGAMIAGATSADFNAISLFGDRLGLLFQIKDDLLDATQSTTALGKTAGKDKASAKATYPAFGGIERTKTLASQVNYEAKEAISALSNPAEILNQIADFILTRNA